MSGIVLIAQGLLWVSSAHEAGSGRLQQVAQKLRLTPLHIEAAEGHEGEAKSQQVQPASGLIKGPDWRACWAVSALVIAGSRKPC